MSFPRYPQYKNSGVEWLGEVPAHWAVTRLKYLCDIQTGDRDTEHAIEGGSYPFFVRSQTIERIDTHSFDCEAILTAGDGAGVGKVFHYFTGAFDFHQRVYMLNHFRDALGPFLFHYLRENFHKVALEGGAKSTVDSLRRPMFTNFAVAVPPTSEQQSIIRFCTRETTKIDALVAEQERLIDLLKEKRQAVISHAVTKGLNPDAPMKPSGVEWLGEVPAHWDVLRLKRALASAKAGPFGSALTKDMYTSTGVRVYGQEQVIPDDFSVGDYYVSAGHFEALKQYCVATGDILVSCVGSFGKIAIVPGDAEPGIINPRLIRLRCAAMVFPEFLAEVLRSQVTFEQFAAASRGGTMDVINIGTLGEVWVVLPPLHEQQEVLVVLQRTAAEFDALITESLRAIDLLQERSTALISAAVTGQLDVRDAVARSAA